MGMKIIREVDSITENVICSLEAMFIRIQSVEDLFLTKYVQYDDEEEIFKLSKPKSSSNGFATLWKYFVFLNVCIYGYSLKL